ncbi:MAG: cache domain-containing protein, partial [Treponema sp.]|nr:cache domain-containing protein [Treponema sp.]
MNRIVRDDLVRNTESILDFVQAQINSDLGETRMILGSYAQTIRAMILHGEGAVKLQIYTDEMSAYMQSSENSKLNINGLYGYIENFSDGPVFLNGIGMDPPSDYEPRNRPWYKGAIAAGSGVFETRPYDDFVTGAVIITDSCCIYDDKGGYLGVVCIDIRIGYIGEKAVNTALTKDGYGFL